MASPQATTEPVAAANAAPVTNEPAAFATNEPATAAAPVDLAPPEDGVVEAVRYFYRNRFQKELHPNICI